MQALASSLDISRAPIIRNRHGLCLALGDVSGGSRFLDSSILLVCMRLFSMIVCRKVCREVSWLHL